MSMNLDSLPKEKSLASSLSSQEILKLIKERVQEVIYKADNELGFAEKIAKTGLNIRLTNTNRAIGMARLKLDKKSAHGYKLTLDLHQQAIAEDLKYVLDQVIPHEIAHMVCFINYALKGVKIKPHGKEFKAICSRLGGVEAAHTKNFSPIKSTRKPRSIYRYEYKLPDGEKLLLTKSQHLSVQKHGAVGFTYRKTKKQVIALNINFIGKVQVR